MKTRNLRLALGLFFALMAVLLFLRNDIAPELAAKFRPNRLALGAWFALVLSAWNGVRWYVEWAADRHPRGVNPLSVKTLRRDDGANPELDFEVKHLTPQPPSLGGTGEQEGRSPSL